MLDYLVLELCGIDKRPKYPFIGSSVRGVFGRALKVACCPFINKSCDKCELSGACVYHEFFENLQTTPNFKLDFRLNQQNYDFKIYLFASAIKHYKKIIIALQNMPYIGFGANREPFVYKQILLNSQDITTLKLDELKPKKIHFSPTFTSGDYEIVTITPIRMKQNGKFVTKSIDFNLFIHQISMKFGEITGIKQPKIQTTFSHIKQNFSFYDITRYSNRHERKMEFGGVMGKIEVNNLDENSAKLLELATLTNVGKSVTFGLGKISVNKIQ